MPAGAGRSRPGLAGLHHVHQAAASWVLPASPVPEPCGPRPCPQLSPPRSRLQRIIHRNDGEEQLCTERDGWCLPKTSDDLRDSMSLMIWHTIRSRRPGERHTCQGPQAGHPQGDTQVEGIAGHLCDQGHGLPSRACQTLAPCELGGSKWLH